MEIVHPFIYLSLPPSLPLLLPLLLLLLLSSSFFLSPSLISAVSLPRPPSHSVISYVSVLFSVSLSLSLYFCASLCLVLSSSLSLSLHLFLFSTKLRSHLTQSFEAWAALIIPHTWAEPRSWQSVFTCYYHPFPGEIPRLREAGPRPTAPMSLSQAFKTPCCPSHHLRSHMCLPTHTHAHTCAVLLRGHVAAKLGS